MTRASTDDIERDEHWPAPADGWLATSHVATVEPKPKTVSVPWSPDRRARPARKPDTPLSVYAGDAALDERCRATLLKLISAGCTRANQPYSLEQFQVAEQELHYLRQHGFVHAEGSALLEPVIASCERQKAGADVGKITIVLNVHLY